ncbi:MAG: porin family protein [Candidatus Krumholzibacteriota bacterium]|nr:porin family protein [Candidatus Krumholzibacteriota bacterium]
MTKTRIHLLAVVLCVASSSAIHAQGFFSDVAYSVNLGLGSSTIVKPDEFEANYNPGFGLTLDVGAQKKFLELVANFDYNFFLRKGAVPNDINILNLFLLVKIKPLDGKVRPYILGGGGYYRFWIFDLNHFENVLGLTGGVGVEIEISKKQRLFLEGKYVLGKTRETPEKTSTQTIPFRIGLGWVF